METKDEFAAMTDKELVAFAREATRGMSEEWLRSEHHVNEYRYRLLIEVIARLERKVNG